MKRLTVLILLIILIISGTKSQNCYEDLNSLLLNTTEKLYNEKHNFTKNNYVSVPFAYVKLQTKDQKINVESLRKNFFCLIKSRVRLKPYLLFKLNNDTLQETYLYASKRYVRCENADSYKGLVRKISEIKPDVMFEFVNSGVRFWFIKNKELYVLKESKNEKNQYIFQDELAKEYVSEMSNECLRTIFALQWVEVKAH